LQRGGHSKHSEWQLALFKLAQQAPHTCTRAIFLNALHADVTIWISCRVEHFRQELL
jgi:hypothetical protein